MCEKHAAGTTILCVNVMSRTSSHEALSGWCDVHVKDAHIESRLPRLGVALDFLLCHLENHYESASRHCWNACWTALTRS